MWYKGTEKTHFKFFDATKTSGDEMSPGISLLERSSEENTEHGKQLGCGPFLPQPRQGWVAVDIIRLCSPIMEAPTSN